MSGHVDGDAGGGYLCAGMRPGICVVSGLLRMAGARVILLMNRRHRVFVLADDTNAMPPV